MVYIVICLGICRAIWAIMNGSEDGMCWNHHSFGMGAVGGRKMEPIVSPHLCREFHHHFRGWHAVCTSKIVNMVESRFTPDLRSNYHSYFWLRFEDVVRVWCTEGYVTLEKAVVHLILLLYFIAWSCANKGKRSWSIQRYYRLDIMFRKRFRLPSVFPIFKMLLIILFCVFYVQARFSTCILGNLPFVKLQNKRSERVVRGCC